MDADVRRAVRIASRANGVYYTPRAVVDYLVRHTLGRLVEGKTPAEVSQLRILDPACGDGAFLRGAYQYLLDWHAARQSPKTGKLSSAARQTILQNNLYGVDIDALAVEKARQSLAAIAFGNKSAKRPAEEVSANIRCGNALIGSDFGGLQRASALDWDDAFREVMQAGGFDAVLGNPPYVNSRLLTKHHGKEIKDYFRRTYRCAAGNYDLYVLFIERAFGLLRPGGRCGMIVPNKLAALDYARTCRELLARETTIEQFVDLAGCDVFGGASVYPYAIVWEKSQPRLQHVTSIVRAARLEELASAVPTMQIPQAELDPARGFATGGTLDVESHVPTAPLAQRGTLHSGTTGFTAQRTADALVERTRANGGKAFDFIVSGNIDRYGIRLGGVRFMKRTFAWPVLPARDAQLSKTKLELYSSEKIVIAGMSRRLEAALDRAGFALGVSVFALARPRDDPRYLLGLINSKLLSHLFRIRFAAKRLSGGYLAVNKGQLSQLPIRVIDFQQRSETALHDELVGLVDRMHHLPAASSRQMQAIDRQIDRIVYQLYGLTAEAIRTVEAAAQESGQG